MRTRLGPLLAVVVIVGTAAWAETPAATLKFTVVKESSGKPVRNASVVLHTVDKNGKQQKGGLQLKTDAEGRASIEGIPYGKMRVQVIARGLQTYGEDYEIGQPEQEFVIKLKPPQEQHSIYK